jgi:hypothetical protein
METLQKVDSGDKYDKLIKLGKLLESGVLTKDEFEIEKKKILSKD